MASRSFDAAADPLTGEPHVDVGACTDRIEPAGGGCQHHVPRLERLADLTA